MTETINRDTQRHIDLVRRYARIFATALLEQAEKHDQSKLSEEEAAAFDEYTPRLAGLTYNSPEYKECLAGLGPALQHHYRSNRHHPEHFAEGVGGMNLLDLVEMFLDWVAAGQRHADGNIHDSIEKNKERFNLPPMLADILHNTAIDFGASLGIPGQMRGRCEHCAYSRFQEGRDLQCSQTSQTMRRYDTCHAFKEYGVRSEERHECAG